MNVLDASALLAYVLEEPGADKVEAALRGSVIHAVNFAEVLSRLAERGSAPEKSMRLFQEAGILRVLKIDFGALEDTLSVARLRPLTKHAGLGLGDRYCLALAERLGAPALTADRAWTGLNVGVEIEALR